MKKIKENWVKIFITGSVIFLGSLLGIYGYRLIHFYKLAHPEATFVDNKPLLLADKVIAKEDIAKTGNGLLKEDNSYYYQGKPEDNYLLYSGRLFRIVSIDEAHNIKIVAEENQTLLSYGPAKAYSESFINMWLNPLEDGSEGVFYKSLNDPDKYLVVNKTCIDKADKSDEAACGELKEEKVGLLSLLEYEKAGANNSYLNTGNYFWLATVNSDDEAWYVFPQGGANFVSNTNVHNYGVRPVITLKNDVVLLSGDGTLESPYIIEENNDSALATKNIGEYVSFSNLTWRIIEKSTDKIKVVLDGYLKNGEDNYQMAFGSSSTFAPNVTNNIGNYLNTTFYNSLENQDYMVSGLWYVGELDNNDTYDYHTIYGNALEAYVGLLKIDDFFVDEYPSVHTLTRAYRNERMVYTISADKRLYLDDVTTVLNVRPAIYLNSDLLTLSGNGSKETPYVIGR